MSRDSRPSGRARLGALLSLMMLALLPGAVAAQVAPGNIAVIDVGRILEDSVIGKQALETLRELKESKDAAGLALQASAKDLQERITAGGLSLSEDKLATMQKDLEDKVIDLKRFQDDANRELDAARQKELGAIESRVMPVIRSVGEEGGYSLIFNKFQSGLVYAAEVADITDAVLARFDQETGGTE